MVHHPVPPPSIAPPTPEAIAATLANQTFHRAVTMPENPHEYALRREWTGPVSFDAVLRYIEEYGYWWRWRGHKYQQIDAGGHFYWRLWPPYILLNRKPLSAKEGEPATAPKPRRPRQLPLDIEGTNDE